MTTATGTDLRLIGAHLKSKAPHGARSRDEIMRKAIANRRKQQAQAVWLRQRVEAHLEAGEHLIVLGDMNDGPGLDEYENLFGHSSVEIIMGEGAVPEMTLYDPHARRALQRRIGAINTTSRFYLSSEKRYIQALAGLHHGVPRTCAPRGRSGASGTRSMTRIAGFPAELRNALITASDHFPVTMDIDHLIFLSGNQHLYWGHETVHA